MFDASFVHVGQVHVGYARAPICSMCVDENLRLASQKEVVVLILVIGMRSLKKWTISVQGTEIC